MGDMRGAYSVLLGKPAEKRPPGRLRRRLKDNVERIILEEEWGGMGRTGLAQDRQIAGSCERGNEH